jgi:hypothetical protein
VQRQEGHPHGGRREEDATAEAVAQRPAPGEVLSEKTSKLLDEVDNLLAKGIDAKSFVASGCADPYSSTTGNS